MRIRHEEEMLKKISDRILVDSYCAVEPVNEEMDKVVAVCELCYVSWRLSKHQKRFLAQRFFLE